MFYALQLIVIVTVTIPLALLTIVLGIADRHGKFVYRINQFWTWIILRVGGIALHVHGLENLDPRRQYVFMVNHQSNIDIPVLVQSLMPFQLRWIAKKELLRVPFFGWAMWATKHITLDRADPLDAVRSLERAKQRIAAGVSIVVFPEGTRSHDGNLLRFKKGGFLLAVKTHTSIVPVTINGSGRVLPAGAWRLRSGAIEVIVDKPVSIEGFRPGNLRLLSDQVQKRIAANLRQQPTSAEPTPINPGALNQNLEKQGI
ncbi:MAG TPA: lysophospholipid acyltransferase family protein [Terriglobales bacterium]|nr:lysophospholipid acyltransferase family protein [Terriglobales bacterium]